MSTIQFIIEFTDGDIIEQTINTETHDPVKFRRLCEEDPKIKSITGIEPPIELPTGKPRFIRA